MTAPHKFRLVPSYQRRTETRKAAGLTEAPPPEAFDHYHIVAVTFDETAEEPGRATIHWYHHEDCPVSIRWEERLVDSFGKALNYGGYTPEHRCWAAREMVESGTYGWFEYAGEKLESGWYAIRPWAEEYRSMEGTEWDGGWEVTPLIEWAYDVAPSLITPDPAVDPPLPPPTEVEILYTNHRGERGVRRITPNHCRFGATEWHPEAQWLLEAYDHDRGERRSFALLDIERIGPAPDRPPAEQSKALKPGANILWSLGGHGIIGDRTSDDDGWHMSSDRRHIAYDRHYGVRWKATEEILDREFGTRDQRNTTWSDEP